MGGKMAHCLGSQANLHLQVPFNPLSQKRHHMLIYIQIKKKMKYQKGILLNILAEKLVDIEASSHGQTQADASMSG